MTIGTSRSGVGFPKYESVAALKVQNLQPDAIAETTSYYGGDVGSGAATYKIISAFDYNASYGTPDEFGDHTLDNGNVAKLQLKPLMTGMEFGLVSDFNEGAATGTVNDDMFASAMAFGTEFGINFSIPLGSYLFTSQQTIRHGVKVNFNSSVVALDYTSTKNDSVFQMGNNTELTNIERLLHRSTSVTSASILGLVKIGEFYVEISGLPNQFENSFDSTYWEVQNVNLENIKCYSAFTPNDSSYQPASVAVYVLGGTNITTNNIQGDGTMADGNLMMNSVIRTETGYDINVRRQGFNLHLINTVGYNLLAQTEGGVVAINGDMNTKILNVRGEFCAQILRLGTNGGEANQSAYLRGKNGVNVTAENIVGINCRKATGFSPVHSLAGLNIVGGDGVALNTPLTNRTRITVKGVYLQGIEVEDATWSRLDAGIVIGDSGSYSGVIYKINRPVITDFEAYWFNKGMQEYDYVEGGNYSNGHLRYNGATGATLGGKNCNYNNIKCDNNNTDGNAFGFNSNGLSISTKRGKFNNCIFGDAEIAVGTESQLSSVVVTNDDTSATFENCYVANYKSGNADYSNRGAVDLTTVDMYIDQRCRGVRNISTVFPIAPDVVSYQGNIQADGTNDLAYTCTVAKVATGRYRITFDTNFQPLDTNYRLNLTAQGGTGAATQMDYSSKNTSTVDVYTKNASGTLTDSNFDFTIWANTPTIQAL